MYHTMGTRLQAVHRDLLIAPTCTKVQVFKRYHVPLEYNKYIFNRMHVLMISFIGIVRYKFVRIWEPLAYLEYQYE